MTNPPQGSDEPGNAPGARYGQPSPRYGPPTPPYGPPAPQHGSLPQPGYGPAAQTPYGRPGYGQYGAPQYGAPGQLFGPPLGAPAEKSRVGLIAAVTGGLLVLIAVVVVLVMGLQSTVLDPAAVERDVAAQFAEREGVTVQLDCADEMEVNSGATYECTGATADGEDVTLRIAIADTNSGAYTWTEP